MTISVSNVPTLVCSAANSQQPTGLSLFQMADRLQVRMSAVPGLKPFLAMCAGVSESGEEEEDEEEPEDSPASPPVIPNGKQLDPVTRLWQLFRLGSSLCALFNAMLPENPLNVVITNDVKTCKRSVYDFVQACKSELSYTDDQLFTISNVFSDNTSDLLKVIHTVKLLLDTLEERKLIFPPDEIIPEPADPKDKRAKTVEELLITERKYVQDLELLLTYQTRLQTTGILSADTIHYLFPNINILIDFQRRFLIGIEYHAQLPPSEQRLGSVFANFQDGFEVYEGFALNQKKACEIATQEAAKLMALSDILEPKYQLPAFLIKPIQRICKYPLLLKQLVKYTPTDATNYQEQVDALNIMYQVTSKVNEQQRRVENINIVRELSERLTDWKGHDVDDFGNLVHDGVFPVIKDGAERDYHLYLFENIILCCKEVPPSKKPMSLSSKKAKTKRPTSLSLKGRIYIACVTDVTRYDSAGYFLHIAWGRGDATDTGFFDIRFRNTEQLEQWHSTILSMMERYNEDSIEVAEAAAAMAKAKSNMSATTTNTNTSAGLDEASDDEYTSQTSVLPMINSTAMQYQQQQQQLHGQCQYQFTNHFDDDDSSLSSDLHSRLNIRQGSIASLSTLHSSSPYHMPRSRSASVPVIQNPVHISKPQHHSMHQQNNHHLNNGNSNGIHNNHHLNHLQHANSQASSATNSMSDLSESGFPSLPCDRVMTQPNKLPGESALSATLGALNGITENAVVTVSSSSSSSFASSSDSGTVVNGLGGNGTLASALAYTLQDAIHKKPEPKMKVKLHFLEDTFLLIVPFAVTYLELLERVERKIRLCGKQTPSPLRIKYKDEDDDFVTMSSDEDVMMAIEPKLSELGPEYILEVQALVKQGNGVLTAPLLGNKLDLLTVWAA